MGGTNWERGAHGGDATGRGVHTGGTDPVGAPHVHPPSQSRPPRVYPTRPQSSPFARRGARTQRWPRGSVAASPALRSLNT